jgi:hypothetical protein
MNAKPSQDRLASLTYVIVDPPPMLAAGTKASQNFGVMANKVQIARLTHRIEALGLRPEGGPHKCGARMDHQRLAQKLSGHERSTE